MLKNNNSPEKGGDSGGVTAWPFDEFHKSWIVMGGELDKFDSACMFDFQLLRAAYCLKNGIDEDAANESLDSTDDLDELYKRMG